MNFGTVYKQTFKSTFSQISTSVVLGIYAVLMILLWVVIPIILVNRNNDHLNMYAALYAQQMCYICTILSTVFVVVISTNANEQAEMTFTISRPVSRKVFLTAKSLCVSTIVLGMFIFMNILCVVFSVIFTNHGFAPFAHWSTTHINWATILLPLFLSFVFATWLPFLLRTFFKDRIITLFVVLTSVLTYQIFQIVFAITSKPEFNNMADPLYGCLIIPSLVYGIFSIVSIVLSYVTINKISIKV